MAVDSKLPQAKFAPNDHRQDAPRFMRCLVQKHESKLDDHDVKYSMSSLTVQLFTTPSVVEHLIEKEDIMESMFEILVERYFPPKLNGQRSLRSIQKGICSTLLHLG